MSKKFKLTLDSIMALGLLLIMVPKLLGHTVHEWAGLVLGAFIISHIVINWNSIKSITLNFLHRLSLRTRFIYILNLIILIGFATIIISGMYISKSIDFSWLGISKGGRGWESLHSSAAYLTFLLAAIHTGMNFRWVLNFFKPVKNSLQLNNQESATVLFRRIPQIVMILCLLAAGIYSFISLNYWSQANPVKIVQAVQSLDQNNTAVPKGGLDSQSDGEQYSQESPGLHEGRGPQGFRGSPNSQSGQGLQQGATANFKGTRSPFETLWNLLMFLGVFASTVTITYLIDGLVKKNRSRIE